RRLCPADHHDEGRGDPVRPRRRRRGRRAPRPAGDAGMNFLLMTVLVAFRVLGRHRMRSALTMLGIIIGVGAVIAMVSIGEGAKAAVQAQIASFGTNVIIILPGAMTVSGVRTGHGGAVPLIAADLDELKEIPGVAEIGGYLVEP